MQVEPAAQTVGPVQPAPPHCPYLVCVAPEAEVVVVTGGLEEDVVPEVGVLGFDVVPTVVVGAAEVVGGGAAPPGGRVVGTVLGCRAVFQVAVVGHAVVATVGDVVA